MKIFSYGSVGQKCDMGLPGVKSRCQQACVPFWRLLGRIHSSPVPAFRVCLHSLPSEPLSTLHLLASDPSFIVTYLSDHSQRFSAFEDLCD